MGFQANIPGVHERAIRQLGAPGVYTPVTGDVVDPCYGIVKHDSELRPDNLDVGLVEVGTTIKFLFSVVGEPKHGATFEVDDTKYRVARIDSNNKTFVTCVVNKVT